MSDLTTNDNNDNLFLESQKSIIKQRLEDKLKKLDKLTDKALREVDKQNKNKPKDVLEDWFKYIEIVSKYIKNKLLN